MLIFLVQIRFIQDLFISRKRKKLLVIFKCNLKLNILDSSFFSQHTSNLNSDVALRVTRRKRIGRIMLKILKVKKYPITENETGGIILLKA